MIFRQNNTARMILISFLVLFFELIAIRWFPAHIRHLGYFTNYILMASFLGIGLGCFVGKKGKDLTPFFLPLLLIVMATMYFFRLQIMISTEEVVYFQGMKQDIIPLEPFYMVPALFILIALLLMLIATPMGQLFNDMEPLKAYKANILGSLAGISLFTLLSFLRVPPAGWMIFFCSAFFFVLDEKKLLRRGVQIVLALLVVSGFFLFSKDSLWSLYYKIDIHPIAIPGEAAKAYDIWVNNTGHQMLVPSRYVEQEPMYGEIYRHYSPSRFKKMLIMGAGGGRDTAYHLSRGQAQIDAVEIEPALMEYGKTLHPEKPYLDSRVRTHVNDARTFMKQCREQYDCIIFALPDSLVLSSSYANLRLESYLFTLESFRDARRLLKKDGIMVLYNYFRKPWLIDKIASMLDEAFGYPPVIFRYAHTMTCFITGPGSMELGMNSTFERYPSATDDWPFLYLKKPSFPSIYVSMVISIVIITLVLSFTVMRKEPFAFNPAFFFLGAAFLLLETKCVVNFSLLFGSTWIVNSIVFFAVLFTVLTAIYYTERFPVKNRLLLYGILMGSIAIQFVVPLKAFLGLAAPLHYIIPPLFYFLPIFFANLVFAHSFRDAREATSAYSSNMLGGILGGITEYFAMQSGYSILLVGVLLFYGAAMFFFIRSKRYKVT